MDVTSAGIESELLDLSTVDLRTLRSANLVGLGDALLRVRTRLADAEGSISGYSGSWSSRADPRREAHDI